MRNEGWYEMRAAEGGSWREWRPRHQPLGEETGMRAGGGGGCRAGRGLRGRERGSGGEVGVELADPPRGPPTLTAVFGSGLSRSPHTNFPFDSFFSQILRTESPTLSQELNTFLLAGARGSCGWTGLGPCALPCSASPSPRVRERPGEGGARSAERAAPSPRLPPRVTRSEEPGSGNSGF